MTVSASQSSKTICLPNMAARTRVGGILNSVLGMQKMSHSFKKSTQRRPIFLKKCQNFRSCAEVSCHVYRI